jgi:hypothetical protein
VASAANNNNDKGSPSSSSSSSESTLSALDRLVPGITPPPPPPAAAADTEDVAAFRTLGDGAGKLRQRGWVLANQETILKVFGFVLDLFWSF